MGYSSQDIKPYEFDWPMVLLLDDPLKIAEVAFDRVEELDAAGDFPGTVQTLREALIAIGPGPGAATRPRLRIGSELVDRQRVTGDLRACLWTCGRLLLSQGGSDYVWEWAMALMRACEHAGMEDVAKEWWLRLEVAYESHVPNWDELDWIIDESDPRRAPDLRSPLR